MNKFLFSFFRHPLRLAPGEGRGEVSALILAALIFFAGCIPAPALTPVTYNSLDFTGTINNLPVTLTSVQKVRVDNGMFIVGKPIPFTPVNGAYATNLWPGLYTITIRGVPVALTLDVPDTNTTVTLGGCVIKSMGYFSVTNLDVLISNNLAVLPGTGTTVVTNGFTYTVSATGGGVTNLATTTTNGLMSSNQVVQLNFAVQTTDSRPLNLSGIVSTGQIVNNGLFSTDGGSIRTDGNGGLIAALFTGPVTGNLTGNVTGSVSGSAASITGVNPVVNGGTAASTARTASQNVAINLVSPGPPTPGNNPGIDFSNATPAFEGQLGFGRFGTPNYFLRVATSTTTGDWFGSSMSLPPVNEFGDNALDKSGIAVAAFHLNTSAALHNNSGDGGLSIYNHSTNANGSGTSYIIPITDGADNVADMVGCGFTWTPTNKIPSLAAGMATINFNTSANMHGFQVVSPTVGPDSGNYSFFSTDTTNDFSGIPQWTQGTYQPGDTAYSLTVSGISVTPIANDGGTVYSNNTHLYVLSVVSLTGSSPSKSGHIILTSHAGLAPASSGTLVKISGTGDAAIAFSSVVTSPWRWALQVAPSTGVVMVPNTLVVITNFTVGNRQWNSTLFPNQMGLSGAVDPNSTLAVTNITLGGASSGVPAINFAGGYYMYPTHGGNDVSIFSNAGELMSWSDAGNDEIQIRGAEHFGWHTDGASDIGSSGASIIGRPNNVWAKNTINAGGGFSSTVTNDLSSQFTTTGITNANAYNIQCIGVTGAGGTFKNTASGVSYSLGTITVPTTFVLQINDALVFTSGAAKAGIKGL